MDGERGNRGKGSEKFASSTLWATQARRRSIHETRGQDVDDVMERGGFAAFLFCFATFESLAWLDLRVSRINSNNVHNNRLSLCVFFCISSSSAYDRPSHLIAKLGPQPIPHRFFLLFLLVSSPMVAFLIASFTQF